MERWRIIPGYPLHMVSSEGRVFSWHSQRFLRPGIGSHGYWKLNLAMGETHSLHVLVAEAFLGPRPVGYDVCHKDDNRLNPRLKNLEYGTRAKNIQATVRRGTHSGLNSAARAKAWATRKRAA
jgi:hypothetical protein